MKIVLPELGEGISNVEIRDVLVKEGDTLSKDDPILILETEKASMEIPSEVDGVISKVYVKSGGTISPNDIILSINNIDENKTLDEDETEKTPLPNNNDISSEDVVVQNNINNLEIDGNQDFNQNEINKFLSSEYKITPQSNRIGYRLSGTKIKHINKSDIISEGGSLGSIQIPGEGQPIILLQDRGTTGGYPKIATIATVDIPKIAQAQPGQVIKFKKIDIEESISLLRSNNQILHNLNSRYNANYYIDIENTEYSSNDDMCIYDLCTEYINALDNTNYSCDNSQSNAVYQEGDQLRCLDVEQNLDLCFPDNCDVPFDLSRLFGKVTWIELTASW